MSTCWRHMAARKESGFRSLFKKEQKVMGHDSELSSKKLCTSVFRLSNIITDLSAIQTVAGNLSMHIRGDSILIGDIVHLKERDFYG